MHTRRSFLKYLAGAAGTSLLRPTAAAAGCDLYEGLAHILHQFPEEYFAGLSLDAKRRLFAYLYHAVRRKGSETGGNGDADIIAEAPALPAFTLNSPYKAYLGDPHGHSRNSDGMRSADTYYAYAKKMGLDFAVLTDHAEILSPREWNLNQAATAEHYAPGAFVTLSAFEYTNLVDGHYDVYLLHDDDGPVAYSQVTGWYNLFVWRYNDYSNDNVMANPALLFAALKKSRQPGIVNDVMAVPHHCSWGLGPTNWDYFDAEVVHFAEGYSKHGNSVFPSWYDDFFDQIPVHKEGCSVMDALSSGKRIGIMAATDNHSGRPGSIHIVHPRASVRKYSGGLTGVLVEQDAVFDRRALWRALKNRRIYGTRSFGLQMSFRVAEHEMGSVIASDTEPVFSLEVYSPPNELQLPLVNQIQYVEIIKNGQIWFREKNLSDRNHVVIDGLRDVFFDASERSYYFLRVVGYSGDLAWSSPIFINPS